MPESNVSRRWKVRSLETSDSVSYFQVRYLSIYRQMRNDVVVYESNPE